MNRPTVGACVALLVIAAAALDAQPARAPKGLASERLLALDPRWTVSFTAGLAASPGFDQQMAYVPLKDSAVVAVTLDDGIVKWTAPIATPFTPATGDGLVFVATDARVTALDQRRGEVAWRADVGSTLSGPPYWEGGWLVVSTDAGELVALNATDGRVLWRNLLGSPLAVRPTSAEERLFVALSDGRLAAVNVETGVTVWTYALNEPVSGLLALPEALLVGTRANRLHSLSLSRGRSRWTQKAGADIVGAPVADEDVIYFVAFDNVLRALDRDSGNLKWTRNLPSRPSGGPIRVDNVVLVPFSTPVIGAYDAASGAEVFTTRAVEEPSGAPFLRENVRPTMPRLIAMSRLGALQGFAARFEPPPSPLGALPGIVVGH